jgi:hypothetical protein
LDQLKDALGNPTRITIFRKLNEMEYISSYSHCGKYYTLKSIAQFNPQGIWRYKSVGFSTFGNLINTAHAIVDDSDAGYTAIELKEILRVETKHTLVRLVRSQKLQREKFDASYVYLSAKPAIADNQRKARKIFSKQSTASIFVANPDLATDEAKAAVLLFFSSLNEQQRRLFAGLESLKLGYGGDIHIATLLGMNPHTVAKGRQEIMNGDLSDNGIRTKGGGRFPQEKKRRKS